MFTAGISGLSANQKAARELIKLLKSRGQARDQGQRQRSSTGASSERILFLAVLGGHVRDIRGSNRDLREDRHREHQFGFCHLHPHHRDFYYAGSSILAATEQFQTPGSVSGRTYLFLVLSGLATGGSWICYFRALKIGQAAQVAPIDKLSVVLVAIFGVVFGSNALPQPNWLGVALIAAGAVLVAYR